MLADILNPLVDAATNVIDALGLPGVFLLMTAESACIPIPSEAIMLFAGFNVSQGDMTLFGIVAAGVLGNLTGSLIARFGAKQIVALGLALEAAAALIGLSGISVAHFWSALVVLGIGWNFGFVGASALVLETHTPAERNKVQAFNDFLVFGTMAIGSFLSGQILANSGWSAVNLTVLPPITLALAALLLTRSRLGRQA